MTDDELKQLIASNARAIEAAAEERAELRRAILRIADVQEDTEAAEERAELRQGIADVQQAILRITDLQQGIANLLSRLDEDRPTILRKLTTIENKVDQLLDRQEGDRP
jgi:negative regulator of replication initiation